MDLYCMNRVWGLEARQLQPQSCPSLLSKGDYATESRRRSDADKWETTFREQKSCPLGQFRRPERDVGCHAPVSGQGTPWHADVLRDRLRTPDGSAPRGFSSPAASASWQDRKIPCGSSAVGSLKRVLDALVSPVSARGEPGPYNRILIAYRKGFEASRRIAAVPVYVRSTR